MLIEEPFGVRIRVLSASLFPQTLKEKNLLQIPKEENGLKPKDRLFFFFHFK